MKYPTIMIELSVDRGSNSVELKTYDRVHGNRGPFLITRSILSRILDGTNTETHYDSDCGQYAEMRRDGDRLWFRITWLSFYDNGAAKGFQQTFAVPVNTIEPYFVFGGKVKLHYSPVHTLASIKTSPSAADTIRHLAHNKYIRRAFSKAMRDCFNWSGDDITLHSNGEYSFSFLTGSKFPKQGFLLLRKGERNGHPYVYYTAHT